MGMPEARFRSPRGSSRPRMRSGPSTTTSRRRLEHTPSVVHRQFSAASDPVLRVRPGDTIHTTTIDAMGLDEKSVSRSTGGNPQTGPFYVEGAAPGDTLVVHL